MMTWVGRVVYERKTHRFLEKDIARIIMGSKDSRNFGDTYQKIARIELIVMDEMKPTLGDVLDAIRKIFQEMAGWTKEDISYIYDTLGRQLGIMRRPKFFA